jgi:predicted nucleic acid-binding protein
MDKMALGLPDTTTWLAAAEIGAALNVRSLDALHLACAQRLRIPAIRFVTFDIRQAIAARALGFSVVGA